MATKPFQYQEMFPMSPDTTEYYLLTSDYVKTENWNGHEMLVVDPEALTVLARQATVTVICTTPSSPDFKRPCAWTL